MNKKPKIIVTLTEGGLVNVVSLNAEEVDVLILEYGQNEEPGIFVDFDAYMVGELRFNEIVDEAIEKINDGLNDLEESDVEEWKQTIKSLKNFKEAV